MAEIKSAIELAMERTKGLHLSREEKGKLKEEEIQAKARALVNRYLEIDFHLREIERELGKQEPPQREQVESLFVRYLCEAIDLTRDNDLIFEGMEFFRKGNETSLQEMKALIRDFRERKAKAYEEAEKDLVAKLERVGVSGSAVQPKTEGSPEWEEALAKFKPKFEKDLAALKDSIKI